MSVISNVEKAIAATEKLSTVDTNSFPAAVNKSEQAINNAIQSILTRKYFFTKESRIAHAIGIHLLKGNSDKRALNSIKAVLCVPFHDAKAKLLDGYVSTAKHLFETGISYNIDPLKDLGVDVNRIWRVRGELSDHVLKPLEEMMNARERLERVQEYTKFYVKELPKDQLPAALAELNVYYNEAIQSLKSAANTMRSKPFLSLAGLAIAAVGILSFQRSQTEA